MTNSRGAPNVAELPSDYRLHLTLDLKEDKSAATAIQVTFVLTAAAMIGLAVLLDFPLASGWSTAVVIVATVAACVFYMVLHELTHGVALGLLSDVPATFAVRLPYLVTGSDAYFNKKSAIAVAVAPAVLWGVVLVVVLLTVPSDLFLTVYVVLTLNLAGSAGDFFQARAISKLPSAALIQDDGEQTSVFVPGP